MLVLGVGIVILILTTYAFNEWYNSIALSESEINAAVASGDAESFQKLIARSEQAGQIRNAFLAVGAIEVLAIVGALVIVLRSKAP